MVLFNPLLGADKEVDTFHKGISLKVKIIVQLEFELAYFEITLWHLSHYSTGTDTLD